MTTGEAVRELRQRMGLTQNRLAILTEVSSCAIRRYESGRAAPSGAGLLQLCAVASCEGHRDLAQHFALTIRTIKLPKAKPAAKSENDFEFPFYETVWLFPTEGTSE